MSAWRFLAQLMRGKIPNICSARNSAAPRLPYILHVVFEKTTGAHMANVIRIHQYGGPEVLQWESLDVGEPAADEVRLRQTAIGLNFIDVYERTGLYSTPLPAVIGREAVGVVEAVGSSVRELREGDRVAYVSQTSGAYATHRRLPASRLVKVPDSVSDHEAAAVMLKGLTAQFLLRRTYRVSSKDVVLIHAAAGGVGLLLVQWAKALGARVLAVVGSEEKRALVNEYGADHVMLERDDVPTEVRQRTAGKGVAVVYDSTGKDNFLSSLDCLRPRGMMVSFGNASGPVQPIAPLELSRRGSLFLTRPSLFHYISTHAELRRSAAELFDLMKRSNLKVRIGQTYALSKAARAHRDLEGRLTTGSTVLIPDVT
jgi:NADPH2:quinone reductase